ncbi:MAG: hypothetical protein ACI9RL_001341 [Candidatus Paceibacteria bacterium]
MQMSFKESFCICEATGETNISEIKMINIIFDFSSKSIMLI